VEIGLKALADVDTVSGVRRAASCHVYVDFNG